MVSLTDLILLCPENLLLYKILLTFSSVTHLSALRKGCHVAYFIDGLRCVPGLSLMGCNSLYNHYSTIRYLNLDLYMVIGGVLHRSLLPLHFLALLSKGSTAITEGVTYHQTSTHWVGEILFRGKIHHPPKHSETPSLFLILSVLSALILCLFTLFCSNAIKGTDRILPFI